MSRAHGSSRSSRQPTSPANIVIFEVEGGSAEIVRRLADRVELSTAGPRRVRAVTHLDVGREDIDRALEAIASELD